MHAGNLTILITFFDPSGGFHTEYRPIVIFTINLSETFLFFSEYTFLSLVVLNDQLTRLSIMLRLNNLEPEETASTPLESRCSSHESIPDTYYTLCGISSGKCAAGCTVLNGSIFVCGESGVLEEEAVRHAPPNNKL